MEEEKKENTTAEEKDRTAPSGESVPPPENNEDFNRTVVIEKPALKRGREQTPLRKIVTPFIRKKQ